MNLGGEVVDTHICYQIGSVFLTTNQFPHPILFLALAALLQTNGYGLTSISSVHNPYKASGSKRFPDVIYSEVKQGHTCPKPFKPFPFKVWYFLGYARKTQLFFYLSVVFSVLSNTVYHQHNQDMTSLLSPISLCPFVVNCHPHPRKPLTCLLSLQFSFLECSINGPFIQHASAIHPFFQACIFKDLVPLLVKIDKTLA